MSCTHSSATRATSTPVARNGTEIELRVADLGVTETIEALRQHYVGHRALTLARLRPDALARLKAQAHQEPPPWEEESEPIPIPGEGEPDPQQWQVFGNAGYRRALQGDRHGKFAVWLPRGITLDIRDFAGGNR